MTNDQLLAAWKRKLPNVEPTDQELTAFALGVEVGQVELATQVALVEKCMVAMNENADRGEKAEAEVGRLVRKLALEREEFKAELDRLKAQPVQEPCAWMYQCTADKSGPSLQLRKQNWAESGSGLWIETPLYAAPVQPALTGEQTCQMCGYVGCDTDAVGECPRCHWDELVPTVGNGLRSALNAMLTQFGIDEDEWNKPTFDQARAALRTGGAE